MLFHRGHRSAFKIIIKDYFNLVFAGQGGLSYLIRYGEATTDRRRCWLLQTRDPKKGTLVLEFYGRIVSNNGHMRYEVEEIPNLDPSGSLTWSNPIALELMYTATGWRFDCGILTDCRNFIPVTREDCTNEIETQWIFIDLFNWLASKGFKMANQLTPALLDYYEKDMVDECIDELEGTGKDEHINHRLGCS